MGRSVIEPKSAGSGIYSASKAFVSSLVQTAAAENAHRIHVNGVLPGIVRTNISGVDDDVYEGFAKALQPLWGRTGKIEEICVVLDW